MTTGPHDPGLPVLLQRDVLLLRLTANGATDREMAEAIGTTPGAVKTRLRFMRQKLKADNKAELVAVAFRAGILCPEDVRTLDEQGRSRKVQKVTQENEEPERYAFMVEGVMVSGTLEDYARHWEKTHYSGDHLSPTVLSWHGTHHTVRVAKTDQHNDYMQYLLTANNESAHASIDGRA